MGLFLFSLRFLFFRVRVVSQNNLGCGKYRLSSSSGRNTSNSTIFSLSSGYGKCGVSVIRVSGPNSLMAISELISKEFQPKPRYASLKIFRHPRSKDIIDRGLVLWFPGPNSFTGEDSCEFQVHGSLAVVQVMLDALSHVPGLCLAKPGEFTKRAFFNGKLDLTEVEGLADLIHAETEAQRKQALLQSSGVLSRIYKDWRKQLIKGVAHLEAFIDFAEDENIEDDTVENLLTDLTELLKEINSHLNDRRQGELLRDGVKTVIIGAPNVGKSSLLNLLCQKNVSIVTSIAGTTRDVIESSYNIGGYPVVFADTAGLRKQTKDIIESKGISKAREYLEQADFVILVIDAENLINSITDGICSFDTYKEKYLEMLGITHHQLENKPALIIVNKVDILNEESKIILQNHAKIPLISCKDNINVEGLLYAIENKLKEICGQPKAENPRLTQSRYRHHLRECTRHLVDFIESYNPEMNPDLALAAQKLRKAIRCIEQITGDVSTDEILDVIFRDFCIGK